MDIRQLFTKEEESRHPRQVNAYIGLGGVGLDALQAVKRQMMGYATVERHPYVFYLGMDADNCDLRGKADAGILRAEELLSLYPGNLFSGSCYTQQTSDAAEELGISLQQLHLDRHTSGSGADTQAARLLFACYKERITQSLIPMYTPFDRPDMLQFHLFVGLGGGMAGALPQLIELIRQIAQQKNREIAIFTYLFLPDVILSKLSGLNFQQRDLLKRNCETAFAPLYRHYTAPGNSRDYCHLIGGRYDTAMQKTAVYAVSSMYREPILRFEMYHFLYHSTEMQHRFAAFGAVELHDPKPELMMLFAKTLLMQQEAGAIRQERTQEMLANCGLTESAFRELFVNYRPDIVIHPSDIKKGGFDACVSMVEKATGKALFRMLERADEMQDQLYRYAMSGLQQMFGSVNYRPDAVVEFLKKPASDLLIRMAEQMNEQMQSAAQRQKEHEQKCGKERQKLEHKLRFLIHPAEYDAYLYHLHGKYLARMDFEAAYRCRAMLYDFAKEFYRERERYEVAVKKLRTFLQETDIGWDFTMIREEQAQRVVAHELEVTGWRERYRRIAEAFLYSENETALSGKLRSACQISTCNRREILCKAFAVDETELNDCLQQKIRQNLRFSEEVSYSWIPTIQDASCILSSDEDDLYGPAAHALAAAQGCVLEQTVPENGVQKITVAAVDPTLLADENGFAYLCFER